ncbi:cation tolerance protein CutA [Gracilaria domingensis]|nr:cation tolerance protein CutA [Gracilaria domingensis]
MENVTRTRGIASVWCEHRRAVNASSGLIQKERAHAAGRQLTAKQGADVAAVTSTSIKIDRQQTRRGTSRSSDAHSAPSAPTRRACSAAASAGTAGGRPRWGAQSARARRTGAAPSAGCAARPPATRAS